MAEQSPSLSSQLKAVARGLEAINFDVNTILPNLQLNDILSQNEVDIIKSKIMKSEGVVALFVDILPRKQMEIIAKMYLTLKVKKGSTLLKLLEEKLGVLDEFRARIQSPEEVRQELLLQNPMSQHPVVLRLKEELKKLFDHSIFTDIQPIPTLPDFSFPIDHIWVDLQIEKPEMKSWQPVAQEVFPSLLQEILKNPVRIHGEPGIGKSTLWKWMCREWSFGRFFTEFDLILPCRLRDMGDCDSILELALSWLEKCLRNKRCVDEFRKKDLLNDLNVLVILDGMDEYSGKCEELNLLAKEPKGIDFSLLLTSRPAMKNTLGDGVKQPLLKIAGLNLENIQLYIAKAFKIDLKDIGHHDRASRVVEAIRLRSNLREMARIPLLLSYICLVPATLEADTTTEVYIELMHFLIATHNRKTLKEDVFSTSDKRLWELGKLAFNGLLAKSEQLVFDETQLTHIDKLFFDAGFLVRETTPELQITTKANFPHKTVQEFLAAVGMVQSMEIGRKSIIARLRAKLNFWKIISSLIESSEEKRVPEAEFPVRLEQTIKFFIGITSNPSYPHAISAQKFLKAYLASTEVRPFVLTSYLKESKSIAFSEIITSHLHKKNITFIGSPLNMASFIQDAPADINLSNFKWIINESFDLNCDLLNFKPKKSAKLRFKSMEVRIELKSFERSLQQYLTDFVKLYFRSIVTDKLSISSGNSDTTLDTHLYQAFSALSTSSCELVNIKNMENICNHSVEGMVLFLRNLKPSAFFHPLIWNIECTDFNPKLLSFHTEKAPLSLEYLRLNFVNNVLDTVSAQHFSELFKIASKLLKSRRLWLSSKQRITINTNLFIGICELANDLLELRIDNICFSGSPINANTSFDKLKLWKFDALRITNISDANTNSVTSKKREHKTQVEINFHDVSVWNTLSGLVDLILGEPRILYLGYSAFGIAIQMHKQQTIKDIMNWVLNNSGQKWKYLEWMLNHRLHGMQDHLKWVLNDPLRAQGYVKWLFNDPRRVQDYRQWELNDPRKRQNYVEWVFNDPRRAQDYVEWVLNDPRRAQYHLKWVLNDPRRTQDFLKWLLNDPRRAQDNLEWVFKDPRKRQDYEEWVWNDLSRQDHLEWVCNEPQRTQDFVNSIRIDQQTTRNDNGTDLLMLQDSKFWKAISTCIHHRSEQPLVIGVRLPKEVIGKAIASVNQLITNLTPPLKDPLRCTFKGEEIEGTEVILERCSDLSMLDFILVINTYSDYSDAVLHVLDILS